VRERERDERRETRATRATRERQTRDEMQGSVELQLERVVMWSAFKSFCRPPNYFSVWST